MVRYHRQSNPYSLGAASCHWYSVPCFIGFRILLVVRLSRKMKEMIRTVATRKVQTVAMLERIEIYQNRTDDSSFGNSKFYQKKHLKGVV